MRHNLHNLYKKTENYNIYVEHIYKPENMHSIYEMMLKLYNIIGGGG